MEKTPQTDLEGQGATRISYFRALLDQGVLTPEVERYNYDGSGTADDPYVVVWMDGDQRNPYNWSRTYKWFTAMSLSFATMAVSFISSAYSGGIPGIIKDFHTSQEVATLGLSLYVLGFALGPLLWAPFSEIYGRQIIFFITFAAYTAFNGGVTASQNIQSIIILRFFSGAFGSSPLTNAGGVIADMFQARERGLAISVFGSCVFLGPSLGPVCSGFLGEAAGWRWVMGFMALFSGVVWLQCAFILPETYAPVLLRKRAEALSKKTGKTYESKTDIDRGKIASSQIFKTSMSRPWVLLFREPIILLLTLYLAIIYGTLYMLFGAFPIVYQQGRGWSMGVGGLAFLGVLLGMLFALAYSILYENGRYCRVADKHDGNAPPEARLPAAMVGGIALPIGLFWFAWTSYPTLPWAASVAAGIPFGFGMVLVFLSVFSYLVDSYTIFAASALAANSILRSLFGAVFPLFTTYMYKGIGPQWATTIPAFLALLCAPFPFIFYQYGAKIRMNCKYAAEAEAFVAKLRGDTTPDDKEGEAGQETSEQQPEQQKEILPSSTTSAKTSTTSLPADKKEPLSPPALTTTPAFPSEEYESPLTNLDDTWQDSNPRRPRMQSRRTTTRLSRSEYDHSPYDIDRVNTRESFMSEGRSRSRARSRGPTGGAGSAAVSRVVSRTTSRHG